jgi:hypothetical protein
MNNFLKFLAGMVWAFSVGFNTYEYVTTQDPVNAALAAGGIAFILVFHGDWKD